MANHQVEMRKIKKIFKLYTGGGMSKRRISTQLHLSRNTVTKYITFLKQYKLNNLIVRFLNDLCIDKYIHNHFH